MYITIHKRIHNVYLMARNCLSRYNSILQVGKKTVVNKKSKN